MSLHIDLSVAIERRESLNATIDRETISAQNINFLDVAIDKNSSENSEEVANDSTTNFDDERNDEIIDWDDEICAKNETIDFDFLTWRVRICSWSLMLLSNLIECLQRLHV